MWATRLLYPVVSQAPRSYIVQYWVSVTHGVLNNIVHRAERVPIATATSNRSEPSGLIVRRVAVPTLRSMHG